MQYCSFHSIGMGIVRRTDAGISKTINKTMAKEGSQNGEWEYKIGVRKIKISDTEIMSNVNMLNI